MSSAASKGKPQGLTRPLRFETLEPRWLLASDFGDAPAPYPTLLEEDGARHVAIGPQLGQSRDSEPNGQPTARADGDGADEDGITFGQMRVGQLAATLTVNVQGGSGKLDGWIDFNGDGSWGGPHERVFHSVEVVPGDNQLTFATPADAKPGTSYARFRLSTAGGLGVRGDALDGEVEDYAIFIDPPLSGALHYTEVEISSGEFFREAIPVDLDHDGDMDILAISLIDEKIVWLEQVAAGEYVSHVIEYIETDTTYFDLAVEDLDGDGDLDIVAATHRQDSAGGSTSGRLYWLRNDDLEFSVQWSDFSGASASSVYLADIDGDGDIDILAPTYMDLARDYSAELVWYENDGSGLFTPHTIASNIGILRSVQAIDLDRDGDLDILTSESGLGGIVWYENDGQQSFTFHRITDRDWDPYQLDRGMYVHAADLDGDQDLDLLVVSLSGLPELAWYEQLADGSYVPRTIATGNHRGREVVAADVDGDGDLDAIFTDLRTPNGHVLWAENRLMGDYNDDRQVDTADYLFWKQHFGSTDGVGLRADGNGDGVVDAADYTIWRNQLETPHPQRMFTLHTGPTGQSFSTKPADRDGDGDLDFLILIDNRLIWHVNGLTTPLPTSDSSPAEASFSALDLAPGAEDVSWAASILFAAEGERTEVTQGEPEWSPARPAISEDLRLEKLQTSPILQVPNQNKTNSPSGQPHRDWPSRSRRLLAVDQAFSIGQYLVDGEAELSRYVLNSALGDAEVQGVDRRP